MTIRLDDEVLDGFRCQVHATGGENYQTWINAALRAYLNPQRAPIEAMF